MSECPQCKTAIKRIDLVQLKMLNKEIICNSCKVKITVEKGSKALKEFIGVIVGMGLILFFSSRINESKMNLSLVWWVLFCFGLLLIYYFLVFVFKKPKLIIKNDIRTKN